MKTQLWVSVEFETPQFDKENLLQRTIRCLVFDGISIGIACFARDAFALSSYENFRSARWENEFGRKYERSVTHWMALPDLPVIKKTTTEEA